MPNRFPLPVGLVLAAPLILGGCSGNDSSVREAAYLDQLVAARGRYSDATLVTAGQDVCAAAAAGNGDAIFADLTDQVGVVNMMRVMYAAFSELCPAAVPEEMQGKLNELDTSLQDLDRSLREFDAKYGG